MIRFAAAAVLLGFLSGCSSFAIKTGTDLHHPVQSHPVRLQILGCIDGKLIKVYAGDVRLNPEDQYGASLLIDGKKLHTNMCYIIREKGLREQPLPGGGG
jgi:hypothetical protein